MCSSLFNFILQEYNNPEPNLIASTGSISIIMTYTNVPTHNKQLKNSSLNL